MERTTAVARPRTFLYLVLDESDSMAPTRLKTVSAYNEFLNSHRRHRVDELFVTLLPFGSIVREVFRTLRIEDTPTLTDYHPDGMTALYDGIAAAIERGDKDTGRGDRVLVVILTDGEENHSRTTKRELRRAMDARCERGNWTFTLLGANIDTAEMAADLGIAYGNVKDYTVEDVGEAMVAVDGSLKTYRERDDLATEDFFYQPEEWKAPNWTQTAVTFTDDE